MMEAGRFGASESRTWETEPKGWGNGGSQRAWQSGVVSDAGERLYGILGNESNMDFFWWEITQSS